MFASPYHRGAGGHAEGCATSSTIGHGSPARPLLATRIGAWPADAAGSDAPAGGSSAGGAPSYLADQLLRSSRQRDMLDRGQNKAAAAAQSGHATPQAYAAAAHAPSPSVRASVPSAAPALGHRHDSRDGGELRLSPAGLLWIGESGTAVGSASLSRSAFEPDARAQALSYQPSPLDVRAAPGGAIGAAARAPVESPAATATGGLSPAAAALLARAVNRRAGSEAASAASAAPAPRPAAAAAAAAEQRSAAADAAAQPQASSPSGATPELRRVIADQQRELRTSELRTAVVIIQRALSERARALRVAALHSWRAAAVGVEAVRHSADLRRIIHEQQRELAAEVRRSAVSKLRAVLVGSDGLYATAHAMRKWQALALGEAFRAAASAPVPAAPSAAEQEAYARALAEQVQRAAMARLDVSLHAAALDLVRRAMRSWREGARAVSAAEAERAAPAIEFTLPDGLSMPVAPQLRAADAAGGASELRESVESAGAWARDAAAATAVTDAVAGTAGVRSSLPTYAITSSSGLWEPGSALEPGGASAAPLPGASPGRSRACEQATQTQTQAQAQAQARQELAGAPHPRIPSSAAPSPARLVGARQPSHSVAFDSHAWVQLSGSEHAAAGAGLEQPAERAAAAAAAAAAFMACAAVQRPAHEALPDTAPTTPAAAGYNQLLPAQPLQPQLQQRERLPTSCVPFPTDAAAPGSCAPSAPPLLACSYAPQQLAQCTPQPPDVQRAPYPGRQMQAQPQTQQTQLYAQPAFAGGARDDGYGARLAAPLQRAGGASNPQTPYAAAPPFFATPSSGPLRPAAPRLDVAAAQQAKFRAHARGARINALALSPGHLFTGADDLTVRAFELGGLQCVGTLRGHAAPVLSLCVPPRAGAVPSSEAATDMLCSGDAEGSVRVWQVDAGNVGRCGAGGPGGFGCGAGAVQFRCCFVLKVLSRAPITTLCCAADVTLVTGDASGNLELWELTTGERLRVLAGHQGEVRNALVVASAAPAAAALAQRGSSGGSLLLSVGEDSQLRWWDTSEGLLSALGSAHVPRAFGAALCRGSGPDSQELLLMAGEDGALYQWHLPALTPRARLTGHTQTVCALATVDGGLTAVSAAMDDSVRLWDVQTGECLAALEVEGACSMVASDWTNRIFVGAADGCVVVIEPVAGVLHPALEMRPSVAMY